MNQKRSNKIYLCYQEDGILKPFKRIVFLDLEEEEIDPKRVLSVISMISMMSIEDICSKSRKAELVLIRNAFFLLLSTTGLSSSNISRYVHRDHSSFFHAIKTIKRDRTYNKKEFEKVKNLINECIYILGVNKEDLWDSITAILDRYPEEPS